MMPDTAPAFDLIKYCTGQHDRMTRMLRDDYLNKDVVLKTCLYGKNRKGRIVDLIFTGSVTFGVDIYRLDGTGFCIERQWVSPRRLAK